MRKPSITKRTDRHPAGGYTSMPSYTTQVQRY